MAQRGAGTAVPPGEGRGGTNRFGGGSIQATRRGETMAETREEAAGAEGAA